MKGGKTSRKSCPDASGCSSAARHRGGTGGPDPGRPSPAPLQWLSGGRRQPGKHRWRCQNAVTCCPKAPGGAAGAMHALSQQLPGGVAGSEQPQQLLGGLQAPRDHAQLPLLSAPRPPRLKTTCMSSRAHLLLCSVSSIIARRDVTQVETCPLCPRLRGAFATSLGPVPSPKGPLVAFAPKPENSEKLVL